ncbi:cysteine--tRNA ligase [Pelagibius sp. Alg239-R121]|uniref:cysteine--tRNA ligase n=1 Tax=Pelagibius sp. Alg239-R121 TaxID=2993448 RepID=UPI0024A69ABF|nr:cysteine--tRNA ligase [Pelagibius sp. Alg239-R121]
MTLRLVNTLTRTREPFSPANSNRVTMYVCGPTVYNFAHIGNARPAVVFDVLYRLLKRHFGRVVYARNFTDVDDKINAAAKEANLSISTVTERYIEAYHSDMAALGVLTPDLEPRVTEHIPEIIDMVERLIARGHAYAVEGHVLFHVPSFSNYGALSGRNRDEMVSGARIEVAPYKQDPADFILWKPSTPDLPGWESPWGRGRPGWHIECSAMIEQRLGTTIDIHGGGQDLIFPHHENEIAQGTCAHDGELYCRHWVHNGFVTVEGRKMSKSLGNVLLVRDLLDEAPGEVIRFALLGAHYRQPLDWSADALAQAKRGLDRVYGTLRDLGDVPDVACPHGMLDAFEAALGDDLNFPRAIAELFRIAKAARRAATVADRATYKAALRDAGGLLGLLQQDPAVWFEQAPGEDADTAGIQRLVEARQAARSARDYATADRIRAKLVSLGITVEDRADGPIWRRTG